MQGLLQRFWQWIQQFFAQVFASSSPLGRDDKNALQQPLSDAEYEFLFSQLLDGVAHGWHEGRILKYFDDLGERGKAKLWVAWLERFGEKAVSSSAPNLQLAARMMRLGELAQSFQKIEPIGKTAYEIGRTLYSKEASSAVWEYAGPDTKPTDVIKREIKSPTLEDSLQENPPSAPAQPPQTETLTIEELTVRLQEDPELAQQVSQQLGVDSTDAQTLVDALISHFEAQQPQDTTDTTTPQPSSETSEISETSETVETYFNQGVEQSNLGDLEAAIALWDQALAIDPTYAPAWHNRGSALGTLGQLEEAITSFDRVLALNGQDIEALNGKGQVLYNLEKWPEAIACWDQVLTLQPNYYQAWYNRGSALELMGRPSDAIESYQKAVEIEPSFELAQNRIQALSQE
ncbi:MAG: tetratricopeptide repeat protein [Crocosphaera sp.]